MQLCARRDAKQNANIHDTRVCCARTARGETRANVLNAKCTILLLIFFYVRVCVLLLC